MESVGARAAHVVWITVLATSVAIFILAGAVLVGLRFGNPGAPKTGQQQHQSHLTKLRTSTANINWRDHVDVGSSAVIAVSLTNPKTTKLVTCQSELPSAEPQVSYEEAVSAVGTPGVPIAEAFGPNYAGYASAHLDTIGFNVSPTAAEVESLDQPRIDWGWTISPMNSGQQYALVGITGIWQPCSGVGTAIKRQLWTSRPIDIAVDEPLLQRNSFDLVGFLTGTAGASSLLLIVLRAAWHWLWPRIASRKKSPTAAL